MLNFSIVFFSIQLFCQFCVVIRFFHTPHNGQWPSTSKDFYTRSYPLHYFLILILEKEPVFPFSMLSAKQGNLTSIWYQSTNFIYNVLHVHKKQQPEETKLPTHVYGQKSISQFITHKLLSSSEHFLTQFF